jgi:putrescine aminotransferase
MTPAPLALRMATYARHVSGPYVEFLERRGLALDIVGAAGAIVWDRDGTRYLDCIAGYGNVGVGHNHPRVLEAVIAELRSPRPYNWPFLSDAQTRLAEELARLAPGALDRSLIVNSGSEAVDSALKLVRLATGKHRMISARGAWHGFTLGALSVSEPSLCRSFAPLGEGVTHVPYGDLDALEQAMDERTGALILEPIQGDGGGIVPPAGYLREAAALCRRRNVVFILDEIKTGLGRTGHWFACEHEHAVPDILLLGKVLGGGAMPIGALIAGSELWTKFGLSFPMSSSSAAGNAPACAAGLATLEVIEREDLCAQAAATGERLLGALRALAGEFAPILTGASGRGLLLSLHTDSPRTASRLVAGCASNGLLVMTSFCNRTRVLLEPPLCITAEQADFALGVLRAVLPDIRGPRD